MNLLSNKKTDIYFLDKESKKIVCTNKISIILSPEFYWLRVFDIPVKSISSALEVLPSLYEDYLPCNDYTYQVKKLADNKFLCFAFLNDDVFEAIKDLEISLSLVDSIYFAQNEFLEYEQFSINSTTYIYSNDLLVKVPSTISLENNIELDDQLNTIKLSKIKVNLKLYKNVLPKKLLFVSLFSLIFLTSINISKNIVYSNEIKDNEKKIFLLKKEYQLPSTMIQTKSIIKNYDKKIEKNLKYRELIKYIIEYKKISQKLLIKEIKIDKNAAIIFVKNINKKRFLNYINKKYRNNKSSSNNNILRIEIIL